MSDSYATASLPEALVARLKELDESGVQVQPIPALIKPLTQREILDAAVDLVPTLDLARVTAVAELSPRRPWVEDVAWLDFSTVVFYRAGPDPFVTIGTFGSAAEFAPFLRLTLANPPAGSGVLVTCRAQGIVFGPTSPFVFRVAGGRGGQFRAHRFPDHVHVLRPARWERSRRIHDRH